MVTQCSTTQVSFHSFHLFRHTDTFTVYTGDRGYYASCNLLTESADHSFTLAHQQKSHQELSWVPYLAKGLVSMMFPTGGQPLYLICHSQPMTMIPIQYCINEYKRPTSSTLYLSYRSLSQKLYNTDILTSIMVSGLYFFNTNFMKFVLTTHDFTNAHGEPHLLA